MIYQKQTTMVTLNQLRNITTFEQLDNVGIGTIIVNVDHRGGGVGFSNKVIADYFGVSADLLPKNFGAGCNYMGGGVRGAIFPSTFSDQITLSFPRKSKLLTELANACVRVYQSIEDENNMNDELNDNGETNWETMATKATRAAGIISAY